MDRHSAKKALQGARDGGIASAAAILIATLLCELFPELDYAATFGVVLVIASGISRAVFNWLKHRPVNPTQRPSLPVLLAIALVGFTLAGCETMIRATGDSMARIQAAENLYVTRNRIIEAEYTHIGAGFIRTPDHPVPLPTVGYNRARFFYGSTPVDPDDAARYISERDVEVMTDGENTVYTGSRTTLHLDNQRYLEPAEQSH